VDSRETVPDFDNLPHCEIAQVAGCLDVADHFVLFEDRKQGVEQTLDCVLSLNLRR
jgi:hypothetical protein